MEKNFHLSLLRIRPCLIDFLLFCFCLLASPQPPIKALLKIQWDGWATLMFLHLLKFVFHKRNTLIWLTIEIIHFSWVTLILYSKFSRYPEAIVFGLSEHTVIVQSYLFLHSGNLLKCRNKYWKLFSLKSVSVSLSLCLSLSYHLSLSPVKTLSKLRGNLSLAYPHKQIKLVWNKRNHCFKFIKFYLPIF